MKTVLPKIERDDTLHSTRRRVSNSTKLNIQYNYKLPSFFLAQLSKT